MDDSPEIVLKKLCCTCLSSDRKLFQLCRVNDGVNNLYSLLSHDSEAYREGFYKEAASLFVCWECEAVMRRLVRFRRQACAAQRQLTSIADGRNDIKYFNTCLSQLLHSHKQTYDCTIISEIEETDNFIECGPLVDIKTENEDLDDIPLSELHINYLSDGNNDCHFENNDVHKNKKVKSRLRSKIKANMKTKKIESCGNEYKDYFLSTQMTEEEMVVSRDQRKMAALYINGKFKCESCIKAFKNKISLDGHNEAVHVEKDNVTRCTVCWSFIAQDLFEAHSSEHYTRHECALCDHRAYSPQDMRWHLKKLHGIRIVTARRKKVEKAEASKPVKQRRNAEALDQATTDGYPCAECNKHFANKNQRWKHVQRQHREGFECSTCGKRFAFKNNLTRHEQVHSGPRPRVQCPACPKLVRVDLAPAHARTHARRERHACAACAKSFVSRASYEHHLKYTRAHATRDILKYKCESCAKGFRSRGELRDHENYRHAGRTRHQCPVCGKALATRRCITRHVRRAHQGVKEGPRDKICQQCGKAFRDKKGLREHEFTHTGERPLACEMCGGTFRHSASLYTHRKRVHKIYPPRRTVQLLQSTD